MQAVTLQSVTKIFRRRRALFNWMGKERSGEVLVMLGPNGSGKTTFLKLISTLLLPDQGRVLVGCADTLREPAQVRKKVGFRRGVGTLFFPSPYCPGEPRFFPSLRRRATQNSGGAGRMGHWRSQA
jgi:ABC-type multidrug transport system ATPase subunit